MTLGVEAESVTFEPNLAILHDHEPCGVLPSHVVVDARDIERLTRGQGQGLRSLRQLPLAS
jgi:hypothetical protein